MAELVAIIGQGKQAWFLLVVNQLAQIYKKFKPDLRSNSLKSKILNVVRESFNNEPVATPRWDIGEKLF